MKATLEFDLENEGDAYLFNLANNSENFTAAFERVLQNVRSFNKHGHSFKTADAAINEIYEQLCGVHTYIID